MKKEILKLIDYLEWLVANVNTVLGKDEKYTINYNKGLCPNIKENTEIEDIYQYVDIEKWEEFSGEKHYPIKTCYIEGIDSGRKEYYIFSNKYGGIYGAARLRLAKWIIEQLKIKINENK